MRGYVSIPIEYIVIAVSIPLTAVSQLEHASRCLEKSTHIRNFVSVKSPFFLFLL